MDGIHPSFQLLQLPDSFLLAVLHCFVDEPRSLSSAARAHSRFNQAAVAAVRIIGRITSAPKEQQQLVLVQQYLHRHGQHVSSLNFQKGADAPLFLQQLPHDSLQELASLRFSGMHLQLQP